MQYGLLQRSGAAWVILEMYLKKLVVVQVKRGGCWFRSMNPGKVKVFDGATGGRGDWSCVFAGKFVVMLFRPHPDLPPSRGKE